MSNWVLSPDRCFDPDPAQRSLAQDLYATVRDLPLILSLIHI